MLSIGPSWHGPLGDTCVSFAPQAQRSMEFLNQTRPHSAFPGDQPGFGAAGAEGYGVSEPNAAAMCHAHTTQPGIAAWFLRLRHRGLWSF